MTRRYGVAVQAHGVHNSAICVRPAACEYLNSIERWDVLAAMMSAMNESLALQAKWLEHYSLSMRFRVAAIGGLTVSDE